MRNIRLLEDRVSQAIRRLRQLSDDRKKLEDELRSLRRELETRPAAAADESGDGTENWQAERAQIVATIRETLQDLRPE